MEKISRLYIFDTEVFDQEEQFNEAYALVDEDRRQKVDRFKHYKSKKLSLGAGFLLHKAMGEIGISDYRLDYRTYEKPYISGHDDVFFNISHSGNMVVLALSDKEVGVDIEEDKHFKDSLVNYVFTAEDISLAGALTEICSLTEDQAFTRLWTAKESIMKYSGMGITLAPKKIGLALGRADGMENAKGEMPPAKAEDCSNPILRVSCEAYDCSRLIISSYYLAGYQLSVCSEYDAFNVIYTNGPLSK
jgi:4'-phosphopantetheinyl transferase